MTAPQWPALVTLLSIFLYTWTGVLVGRARGRFGVRAPATSGHPEFERTFRVQMNTLENLVAFLPALWLFALYVGPIWAALLGGAWLAGRLWYAIAYVRDPATRGSGFALSYTAFIVLAIGATLGLVRSLLA